MKLTMLITSLLLLSFGALARINGPELARLLYPTNEADQAFMEKFFEIVELHKTQDPLLEGKGPSIQDYSLDKIKFAFMINDRGVTVDLAIFNWTLPHFEGLSSDLALSVAYGEPVYLLRGIAKTQLASQGENNDLLTNFSYVNGSRFAEAQIRASAPPEVVIPEELLNWKPHPGYMDGTHPLREALNTQTLTLLSPSQELFTAQGGELAEAIAYLQNIANNTQLYYDTVMGMMVHEIFHVKEGEDNANALALGRDVPEDRTALVNDLQADAALRKLYATYARIVFSIGDSLKAEATPEENEKLADLKNIIAQIKAHNPNAWAFIWNYEFTEGFAEYVSAYSMVQVGVTTLSEQIDSQKTDVNNMCYRTGTMGGLYLALRLGKMPFEDLPDHRMGLWEIVFEQQPVEASLATLDELANKYAQIEFQDDAEIEKVVEYLVSTIEPAEVENPI